MMKKIILLAMLLLAAASVKADPAFVQVKNTVAVCSAGVGTNTCALTYTSNTGAGNLLVAVPVWFSAVTASMADTQGNTWSNTPARPVAGGSTQLQFFYTHAGSSAADTVTVTWSGGGATFSDFIIAEYACSAATTCEIGNYDDQKYSQVTVQGMSTTPVSTQSFAGANHDGNQLVIGLATATSFENWTVGGSWNLRSTALAKQMGLEDQVVTNGSYTASFTMSGSVLWVVQTIAIYQTDTSVFRQERDHDDGVMAQNTPDANAFFSSVTAGQLLFLNLGWVNSPLVHVTSVTGCGATWTALPESSDFNSNGTLIQAWYGFAGSTGTCTPSIAWGGGGASFLYVNQMVLDCAGCVIDQHDENVVTSATPSSPAVTTTANGEVWITYLGTPVGFQTIAATGSWANRATSVRSAGFGTQTNKAAGTAQGTFATGSNNLAYVGIATFKVPSAAVMRRR